MREFEKTARMQGEPLVLSRVGTIIPDGLILVDKSGCEVMNTFKGFDHFANENV